MKIIERPDVARELLNNARGTRPGRNPGIHQSDVNGCLRRSVVTRLIDRPAVEIEEGLDLMFLRGEGIHHFLSEGKPELVVYVPDFGWCSVDRQWTDEAGIIWPMELKSTRYSSAYPLEDHPNYIIQAATYLAKIWKEHPELNKTGQEPSTSKYKAYVFVMFENGDYDRTGPNAGKPEIRAFELDFTGPELDKFSSDLQIKYNWLVASYDAIEPYLREQYPLQLEKLRDLIPVEVDLEPMLPPVGYHWPYDCEHCMVKELINCPGNKTNAEYALPFVLEETQYTRVHRPPRKGK